MELSPVTARPTGRRLDIERAKGLAIALVVVGHITSRNEVFSEDWYNLTKYTIYTFHMPFFMYLSGMAFFLSGSHRKIGSEFPKFIASRANRLLVPFFAFGIFIIAMKLLASQFVDVPNSPESIWSGVESMLLYPERSPVLSIWYIFVLFMYCVVTPILFLAVRGNIWLMIIFGVAVYYTPLPSAFFLQKAGTNWVFFLIGGAAALNMDKYYGVMGKYFFLFAVAFVASLVSVFTDIPWVYKAIFPALLSIPTLHQVVIRFASDRGSILLWLGTYSFVIYLLNTIFIGVFRELWVRFLPFEGPYFIAAVLVLSVIGLVGPVLLKLLLLDRVSFLKRITT